MITKLVFLYEFRDYHYLLIVIGEELLKTI